MSRSKNIKSKYVTIDPKNPNALGVCDESGFDFNHKDLVKQMQWRGNQLIWTGLMVGKPYLDVPSQQDRPPIVRDDPKPVKDPRLPASYTDPNSNNVLPNKALEAKLNNVHCRSK